MTAVIHINTRMIAQLLSIHPWPFGQLGTPGKAQPFSDSYDPIIIPVTEMKHKEAGEMLQHAKIFHLWE